MTETLSRASAGADLPDPRGAAVGQGANGTSADPLAPVETPPRMGLIFSGLVVVMLLSSLGQMVFATALPTVVGELDGVELMLWVTTAFILASTITMPIYGKLSDLMGRKPLLISAILIFLAGSVVGGFAQDMGTLIVGRAIQGLGGGGLMILSQAVIADIVPPKDRGRYMGPLGAVFGVSAILGPILGGWFTEGIGWRWAFWMNVPLAVLALVAITTLLHLPHRETSKPRLDVLGIALMSIAVTALVLVTSWGGSTFEWTSPVILCLSALTLVASAAFVLAERRAAEPIIPLHLFRDRNFVLATSAGLIIGVSMFGVIGYIPTYLQMTHSLDATASGLYLVPMMLGLLVAGVIAGQIASRTAHYKWMPLVSVVVTALGLGLLSTLHEEAPAWLLSVYVGVLGAGIGFGMQLLVLIVQNSFPLREVGTATAANNFFRQVGASLGSAIVGSVFVSRLTGLLAERLPAGAMEGGVSMGSFTPAVVAGLPDAIRLPILGAYNDALTPIFLALIPALVVAFALLLFIEEKPLKTTLDKEIATTGAIATQ